MVLAPDIGCRVYSNTNTSPCASPRSHRTKLWLGCASPTRLTPSPVSSCFSAESAPTMLDFGRRRDILVECRWRGCGARAAGPIALCSECWNGADWKSNEYVNHVRENLTRVRRLCMHFMTGNFFSKDFGKSTPL